MNSQVTNMNTEEFNFDDVTPIPVSDDSEVVLCKIMYTDEFKVVFGYLRALMSNNELSKRAKYVACRAISLVPAHYTVWQYKYNIVEKLMRANEYDIMEELEWCSNIALENEKNYQIWHYRGRIISLIVETIHDGDKDKFNIDGEHKIVSKMLENDEKNYHVWSYKRWLVEYFDLFHNIKELEYTENLILADVRNNSAWNFRHFINFGNADIPKETGLMNSEVEFTIKQIHLSITNPSSWNYLKFLYKEAIKANNEISLPMIRDVVQKYTIDTSVAEELDQNALRVSVPAYELRAALCGDEGRSEEQRALFTLLGQKLDPVRRGYWAMRAQYV